MARLLGIDVRPTLIRAALLRTSYRRVFLEGLNEVERGQFATLEEAISAVAQRFTDHHEAIAVALEGNGAYIHRLALPPAALKQVDQVLPFELEAQIPVDFEELVFDSRVLPRERGEDRVDVFAAAARVDDVRSLIELTERALGHEPERVGVGPVVLGNLGQLSRVIRDQPVSAILDLGDDTSEIAVIAAEATVFARTLSVGVVGLPGNAHELVSAIRQSLVAWGAESEHPVETLYLCGAGAELHGMEEYLKSQLGVEVAQLPVLEFEGITSDQQSLLGRYAKAVAVAASLRAGSKDLNLRRGPLIYSRGYGFLKEKIPALVGLVALSLVSFVFSAWAESRVLSKENTVLASALAMLSKQILQEESDDAERVLELLDRGATLEKDPQPEMDGFDLIIALATRIPKDIEHDIADIELLRGHVKLSGVVPSTGDAQRVAEELKKEPCFKDVNISKITQAVKSDRQKYAMEFDVRCEEEKKKPGAAKKEDG